MKIYDKEIYRKQESMRSVIIMIIVFLVGFFAGYIINMGTTNEKQDTTNNTVTVE